MITIIDYGMGNLGSIANMIKRIGHTSEITSDIDRISDAERIILPGVGHFDKAMHNITELGLFEVIQRKAIAEKTPILGICLGMQLMCNKSEEGARAGLRIIDADVRKFKFRPELKLKIPHMGWNKVHAVKQSPLFLHIEEHPRFYFVHSYHVVCQNPDDILATTSHGYDFHSAFSHENITGVQFHPEKSHKFGMQMLKNFIENCRCYDTV
jgi:glutamine amidotransferase